MGPEAGQAGFQAFQLLPWTLVFPLSLACGISKNLRDVPCNFFGGSTTFIYLCNNNWVTRLFWGTPLLVLVFLWIRTQEDTKHFLGALIETPVSCLMRIDLLTFWPFGFSMLVHV